MARSIALAIVLLYSIRASPMPQIAGSCTYTVQPGDVGYKIAEKAHLTVEDLSKLNNNFTDWIHLHPGQKLNVCKVQYVPPVHLPYVPPTPPQTPCEDCVCNKITGICTPNPDSCKTFNTTSAVNPNTNQQSCLECNSDYDLKVDASNSNFKICVKKGPTETPTCPTGVATTMWKGKCVALIDGCSSTGYSDDGSKCIACIAGYFVDNGKCSPVVHPPGCSSVDDKLGLNNITNQLSCTACNKDYALFQDPNNSNFTLSQDPNKKYQLCIQSSSSFDGGYAPLFGIVKNQYYCAKRHPDMTVSGWEEMVLDLCTDVQFKDENVFSGTMPIKVKDGNSTFTFPDYVKGQNGKSKGAVILTYRKSDDKQATNFDFQSNQLKLESADPSMSFTDSITTCAFIDSDNSVYLNPNGDKNSCARLGMLKKV